MQRPNQQKNIFSHLKINEERKKSKPSSLIHCLDGLKANWKQTRNLAGLWQDWSKIAGDPLASNCKPISLHSGVLTIGSNHPQWLQALQYNRIQLQGKLKAAGYKVREIRIRQYHATKQDYPENNQKIWENHPSRIDIHGISSCQSCGRPAPDGELKLWGKCGFCRREDLSKSNKLQ